LKLLQQPRRKTPKLKTKKLENKGHNIMSMSIFNKVAEAQALNNSTYFQDGHYLVEILDAQVKENRHGLLIAIIECRVEKCSNPGVRVGSTVSWVCKLQGSDIGPRDLKTQFCGIVNCRPNQISADLLEKSFNPDPSTGVSPLAGVKCYVYAYQVQTQKGGSFTKVEFRGIQEGVAVPDFQQAAFVESVVTSQEGIGDDDIPF
jgi:hypothetical protein